MKVYPLATQILIYLHLPPNKQVKQHSGVLILLSSGGPRLQQLPLCHIPAAFPTMPMMPYIFSRAPSLPLVTFSWFGRDGLCCWTPSPLRSTYSASVGQSLTASVGESLLSWFGAVNNVEFCGLVACFCSSGSVPGAVGLRWGI